MPALATLAILLSGLIAANARAAADRDGDNDLLEAVELELSSDGFANRQIDVQVESGVVTLSGRARTLLGKHRVTRLVKSLRGVRAVVDRMSVLPSARRDTEVLADLKQALEEDPVADADELQVAFKGGDVTLTGTVDSHAEKQLVEATCASVRGVQSVENQLVIVTADNRPDEEIAPEIRRRFAWNPYLADGLIDVRVAKGEVFLSGVVGSASERDVAGLLSWVAGVRRVDSSGLEVEPGRVDERRCKKFTVLRNDLQLQRAVKDALLYDPRVRGHRIDVRVRQGAVSLVGKVGSLTARRFAEEDARNTLGVRRVRNHLKVRVPKWPGDPQITERAQKALSRDSEVSDSGIRASSHFGTIFLTGQVSSPYEKARAERVVANVTGVLEVENRLSVEPGAAVKPDEEIAEDLQRRLRWSPLLEAARVDVTVESGRAKLSGEVDSWQEREAAARHAAQAGAREVLNQLRVRPRYPRKTKPTKPRTE